MKHFSTAAKAIQKEPQQSSRVDDFGGWVCLCDNKAEHHGFYPCDETGKKVEPTHEDWTTNCYVCDQCGRIIEAESLTIIGYRNGNIG